MKLIVRNSNLKSQWISLRIKRWDIKANLDYIVNFSKLAIRNLIR